MQTETRREAEPWLTLGDEDVPPEAIQALYTELDSAVSRACERARRRMQQGHLAYVRALEQVRKALAPYGKFKEWCIAYGLNYGTVCNQLSRANKLATNEPLAARSQSKGLRQLVVRWETDEEKADTVARLRAVLDVLEIKHDDWRRVLLFLLDYYDQHAKGAAA